MLHQCLLCRCVRSVWRKVWISWSCAPFFYWRVISFNWIICLKSRVFKNLSCSFFLLLLLYFLPWSFWQSKLYFNLISRTSKIFSFWYNVFYDPSSAVSLSRLIWISTTLLNLGVNITHSPPFGVKLNMPADIKQLLDEVEHDIMRKPNSIIVLLYIFSHNSSSETEAKRSAILLLRRTLQGA